MASESPAPAQKKHLDREIREMVSSMTQRVTDFHKTGSTQHLGNNDEHDMRIITLAGTNDGATLRSQVDEKSGKSSDDEPETLSTFVNSNFQAVNNSIMLGGSYQANDPGVRLDITDHALHHMPEKQVKKGKKKDK
ncbi:hypothetical protein CR513_21107, partial [Mucuna pruriens]